MVFNAGLAKRVGEIKTRTLVDDAKNRDYDVERERERKRERERERKLY